MANIVVVGGGILGLSTGMLLAGDGHGVTVLERDPEPPPTPQAAWDAWTRKGVNQFRLLHFFAAGFHEIARVDLPQVVKAMKDAGALQMNFIDGIPDEMTGGRRDTDDQFTVVTARRPVGESAIAAAAAATAGVTVERGVTVKNLLAGDTRSNGDPPHVVGVVTDDGREFRADLVIDAAGRRSALPSWLDAIGAQPLREDKEDSGFIYYGRHFASSDGSTPAILGGLLTACGTVSILTLPADNGTWGVGLITSAKDAALRGLKDVDTWTAAVKSFPLHAHWLDGAPIDDSIAVMAKIEDRHRTTVVDGAPVVTGVLTVGDSWACTNPSLGRGMSIGLMHARALRDHLRDADLDDRAGTVTGWAAATEQTVDPWYRSTLHFDRNRLAEVESLIEGKQYEPDDPAWEMTRAFMYASAQDPDLLRAFIANASVLQLPEVALADPALAEKVVTLGAGWRDEEPLGPSRDDLLKLVGA